MINYDALKKLNIPYKVITFTDAKSFLLEGESASAQSVVVFLMPYSAGKEKGNISYYAKGRDYHLEAKDMVHKLSCTAEIKVCCDVSPFDERKLAAACGLGVIGKNKLLINEEYGSFVFIAEMLVDDVFDRYDEISDIKPCMNCGRCVKACPVSFEKENCISHITQKKGFLTEKEKSLIRESGYIWGCDLCQLVCPMNKLTNEVPFSLEMSDVEGLSNREFKEKYNDFAFTWRGVKPLQRNLEIIK